MVGRVGRESHDLVKYMQFMRRRERRQSVDALSAENDSRFGYKAILISLRVQTWFSGQISD